MKIPLRRSRTLCKQVHVKSVFSRVREFDFGIRAKSNTKKATREISRASPRQRRELQFQAAFQPQNHKRNTGKLMDKPELLGFG